MLFDETNPKSRSLVYRIPHLLLSVLALAGLVFAPKPIRRALAPTALVAVLIALFHSLTIVSARFHIPIEPLFATWAGAILTWLKPSQNRRKSMLSKRVTLCAKRTQFRSRQGSPV